MEPRLPWNVTSKLKCRLVMRFLLLSAAAIVCVTWGGSTPATAALVLLSTIDNRNLAVKALEKVGYSRRQYRRAYRSGSQFLTLPKFQVALRRMRSLHGNSEFRDPYQPV